MIKFIINKLAKVFQDKKSIVIQTVSGSIVITRNKSGIYFNGEKLDLPDSKEINIQIEGDLESLTIDTCSSLRINGNVGDIQATNGDIKVKGDIQGNVLTTNGDIKADPILGKVRTVNEDIISN